ncbi:hypothetical protein BXZ70DRAFT_1001204 [Cristinia sonorae]|uniref:Urease accessory protein UreF n=1 Tax=Cristinia sonorae TaxID=1940300 RepID=A0A8K0XNB1_9AGAR|nr:hypothetical protein BXZ70DRAFT_1001204 [Cristinia sonorae]
MDTDEAYILLLLSDSNLPTGSFVASSGLESYATHGFLRGPHDFKDIPNGTGPIVEFVRHSMATYGRSALPFVADAHQIIERQLEAVSARSGDHPPSFLQDLITVDELYDSMTLSHVTRRASKAQGVALLTLYSKGFAKPRHSEEQVDQREAILAQLIDELKLTIRRELTPGHLPTCWGVLTAALERSQFLHLFLFARGVLSAAVRMNNLGPYGAQQLLLHTIRPLVEQEAKACSHLRTGLQFPHDDSKEELNALDGPAMTWPLGEILACRHDLQHSRVFNS